MTDPFASYGATAAPKQFPKRGRNREVFAPSALEKKQAEKQRLSKAYRIDQRKRNAEIMMREPRLKGFMRYLKTIGPDDGDDLIEQVRISWLRESDDEVKTFAKAMITARCDKIARVCFGREPLDDPLPPEMGGPPANVERLIGDLFLTFARKPFARPLTSIFDHAIRTPQ